MRSVDRCRHGVTQDFSEKTVRLCVSCIADDTGIPAIGVQMVLAWVTRHQVAFMAALEKGVPPVSYKDVEEAHEVLGRKGIVTFADLGLYP